MTRGRSHSCYQKTATTPAPGLAWWRSKSPKRRWAPPGAYARCTSGRRARRVRSAAGRRLGGDSMRRGRRRGRLAPAPRGRPRTLSTPRPPRTVNIRRGAPRAGARSRRCRRWASRPSPCSPSQRCCPAAAACACTTQPSLGLPLPARRRGGGGAAARPRPCMRLPQPLRPAAAATHPTPSPPPLSFPLPARQRGG